MLFRKRSGKKIIINIDLKGADYNEKLVSLTMKVLIFILFITQMTNLQSYNV